MISQASLSLAFAWCLGTGQTSFVPNKESSVPCFLPFAAAVCCFDWRWLRTLFSNEPRLGLRLTQHEQTTWLPLSSKVLGEIFFRNAIFFPSSMSKLTILSEETLSLPARDMTSALWHEESMKCRLTLNKRCFVSPGVIWTSHVWQMILTFPSESICGSNLRETEYVFWCSRASSSQTFLKNSFT